MNSSFLLLGCLLFSLLPVTISRQPNILFILADDLGWNDVGFHGSRQVDTPNIDALANAGVILNNYYVLPMCSPSRSSLMTGRYPARTGMQFCVIIAGQRLGLPLEYKILPEYLNDLGYESHAVGKWHLGFFHRNYTPTYRGFKSYYGYYNGQNDYFDHRNLEGGPGWWGLDWHLDIEGNLTNVDEDFGLYSTHAIANRSKLLVENHDFNKPLFLYVAFQSVHSGMPDDPIQVPTQTEYDYKNIWNVKRRKFVGVLKEMDNAIGEIIQIFEQRGALNDTIIVFSTDNGGPPNGFNRNWANNFPLRAGKGYFYEGGARGSALVSGPMFNKRSGDVSKELMHISDWFPTLIEAAGGNSSSLGDIDGRNMWDVLTGRNLTSPRTEVLINMDSFQNSVALKMGGFKYLKNPHDRYSESYDNWFQAPGKYPDTNETLIPGTTKSQVYCGPIPDNLNLSCFSQKSGNEECLFDIENDPCEFFNLIDNPDFMSVKEKLLNRVEYWKSQEVTPLWPPIDPEANPLNSGYIWQPWTNDPTIPPNANEGERKEILMATIGSGFS